jgi:hypothetical protein
VNGALLCHDHFSCAARRTNSLREDAKLGDVAGEDAG